MADVRDIYVVSDQDDAVLAAVQSWAGDTGPAVDDDDSWITGAPGLSVDVWKGAADFEFEKPVRWVTVADWKDSVDAALRLAAGLRAKGFVVILDPDDPDLLAAAQAAHIAAA